MVMEPVLYDVMDLGAIMKLRYDCDRVVSQ
jgi:hypothetical protein